MDGISVPEPCSQSWEQMNVVEGGRHCEIFCKTVMDFTGMNNDEILVLLSISTGICGRFSGDQLKKEAQTDVHNIPKRSFPWRSWTSGVMMLLFVNIYKLSAQTRTNSFPSHTKVISGGSAKRDAMAQKADKKIRSISGTVTDDKNRPLFMATIAVPGTIYWVQTDTTGRFIFDIPTNTKRVTISAASHEDKRIELIGGVYNYEIKLIYRQESFYVGEPIIQNAIQAVKPKLSIDFKPVLRNLFN